MKKSTIQIEIPEGFMIEAFNQQTGEVTFTPKPKELLGITTFEEVCQEAGVDPADYVTASSRPMDILLNQVKRIGLFSEVFNQGEVLDAANTDQKKWFPVFIHTESGFRFDVSIYSRTYAYSVLGPLLGFKDEETSDYVGKTFLPDFEKIHFPI